MQAIACARVMRRFGLFAGSSPSLGPIFCAPEHAHIFIVLFLQQLARVLKERGRALQVAVKPTLWVVERIVHREIISVGVVEKLRKMVRAAIEYDNDVRMLVRRLCGALKEFMIESTHILDFHS